MGASERSVLHVLPHPGGGGETYVDLLDDMPGYRFERTYLAHNSTPPIGELGRGVAGAFRRSLSCDLIHVHGEAAAALCLPLLAARPSVVTLNGLHLVRRLNGLPRRAAELNLHAAIRAADRMICVSRAEQGYLKRAIGRVAETKAVVIHNGVRLSQPATENERLETRRELGIPDSEPLAIWIGSLDQRKNPLAAVRAAERVSVTLLVVGDGPLRPQIEHEAGRFVRVLGQRNDVQCLLGAADFCVVTSHREGLAFSLLEAMTRGLPAVVTDIAENVEAVGESGIVVDDDDSLAVAMRRLAASPDQRVELGARASERVARLFGAIDMARRTRALYDGVPAGVRIAT